MDGSRRHTRFSNSENGVDGDGQGQEEERTVKGSSQVSMLNYIIDTDVLYYSRTRAGGGKSFISKVKGMHSVADGST